MLLYIIRHGDPIYEPDSLTELGKIQAQAVAKRLSIYGIDKIYSSPLIRARQTAEPTAIMTKNHIEIEDWMSEDLAADDFIIESGGWVFQNQDYIKIMRSQKIFKLGLEWYNSEEFSDKKFKNGYERILNKSDRFFKKLGYIHNREERYYSIEKPNDMRVAVFCHQGFGLSWIGTLLDIPLPEIWTSFDISHSNVTVVEFSNKNGDVCVPKVLTMSNDSHLYREGIPTKYNNEIYI